MWSFPSKLEPKNEARPFLRTSTLISNMSGRSGNNKNGRILRRSARHPSFDSSSNNNNNKPGGGIGVGESSSVPLQQERESRAASAKTNKNAGLTGTINTIFRVGDQVEVRTGYGGSAAG
jgi:hypothetical protein